MVPSGVLAGAAVGATVLAGLVADLAGGLALPATTATAVTTSTRRIVRVLQPRIGSLADVAAIAVELVAAVQMVARAASPGDAAAPLYRLAAGTLAASPRSASPVLIRDYALARALAAGIEVSALGEAFLAETRTEFSDRRAATEARARITAALDGASDRIAALLGQAVLGALTMAARQAATHLVRRAADLQPVVRVDTPRSLPSTVLAWELYGDPSRAPDLVARNRVATPLFMPTSIEAIAPGT